MKISVYGISLCLFMLFNNSYGKASKEEILDSMNRNIGWQNKYSIKNAIKTEISDQDVYSRNLLTANKDGLKTEWLIDSYIYSKKNDLLRESDSFKRLRIMTPEKDYDIQKQFGYNKYYGTFGDYAPQEQSDWIKNEGFLDGTLPGLGSSANLSEEFKKHSFTIAEQEMLNNIPCVLLEMDTTYGKVKAWLDPEKNYSILKYSLEKTAQDLWTNEPLSETTMKDWSVVVNNIELEKVGEYFIPTKGTYTRKATFKDGKEKITRLDVQREQIDLNPDFEKMGAFEPNIPDGSILFDRKMHNIPYEWIGGKLVPYIEDIALEELDRAASELGVSYIKPAKTKQNISTPAEMSQNTVTQPKTVTETSLHSSSTLAVAAKNYRYRWFIGAAIFVMFVGSFFVIRGKKK